MLFIDALPEAGIWQIGDDVVGQNRGKPAIARADIKRTAVIEASLSVTLAPAAHPRHADIGSWPADKDAQKLVALDLCAKSKLCLRPGLASRTDSLI